MSHSVSIFSRFRERLWPSKPKQEEPIDAAFLQKIASFAEKVCRDRGQLIRRTEFAFYTNEVYVLRIGSFLLSFDRECSSVGGNYVHVWYADVDKPLMGGPVLELHWQIGVEHLRVNTLDTTSNWQEPMRQLLESQ